MQGLVIYMYPKEYRCYVLWKRSQGIKVNPRGTPRIKIIKPMPERYSILKPREALNKGEKP